MYVYCTSHVQRRKSSEVVRDGKRVVQLYDQYVASVSFIVIVVSHHLIKRPLPLKLRRIMLCRPVWRDVEGAATLRSRRLLRRELRLRRPATACEDV